MIASPVPKKSTPHHKEKNMNKSTDAPADSSEVRASEATAPMRVVASGHPTANTSRFTLNPDLVTMIYVVSWFAALGLSVAS